MNLKYSVVHIGEHAGIHAGIPTLRVLVALVDSNTTLPGAGDELLAKIRTHFPTVPAMLVSVEDSGFRAYAPFQTHTLLAYLQIPLIDWTEFDLDTPLPEDELPF